MNRQDLKHFLGGVARAIPRTTRWPLSTWGLTRNAGGELKRGGVALGGLLERYRSPLYVLDQARLDGNAARFLATPPGCARGAEPYYSYKTNPVPRVLQRLHLQGVGAEVASPYELWLALELGVPPSAIVFDAPAKTPDAVALAIDRGVGLINLNGRGEIALVAELARARHKRPRVGLRVVVPGGRAGQFGERIETGAALEAFREARARPELDVVGLHSHVNGEISTSAGLEALVTPMLAFTERLRRELGLELEVLDFGGNLACPTVARLPARALRLAVTFGREPDPRPPEAVLTIEDYLAQLISRVERHATARGVARPRIFLEPGRAMTSDTMMLLTRVLSVRGRDDAGATWAILDAGINVAEPVPHEYHHLLAVAPRSAETQRYRLTGPSCTMGDLLYPAWELPELAAGDALAIMDTGAYFVPLSTCFSFARPAIVSVHDGQVEELRRAETFEDLVARDQLAPPRVKEPRRSWPAARVDLRH
ncbi:MAG: pyridoxal-dependent decarboxylase [Archangium sp.]|nr:pyridoxal-dependent decarboxylase [Archangium sp.]